MELTSYCEAGLMTALANSTGSWGTKMVLQRWVEKAKPSQFCINQSLDMGHPARGMASSEALSAAEAIPEGLTAGGCPLPLMTLPAAGLTSPSMMGDLGSLSVDLPNCVCVRMFVCECECVVCMCVFSAFPVRLGFLHEIPTRATDPPASLCVPAWDESGWQKICKHQACPQKNPQTEAQSHALTGSWQGGDPESELENKPCKAAKHRCRNMRRHAAGE